MNKWHYTIIVITIMVVASVFILATQPPPKYIEVCDKSHEETILVPVTTFVGQVPITNYIPTEKTICDESHEELNPEWLEQ